MGKLSEIDLGSTILSLVIGLGFIATAFALIRLAFTGINLIIANGKDKNISKEEKNGEIKIKGF